MKKHLQQYLSVLALGILCSVSVTAQVMSEEAMYRLANNIRKQIVMLSNYGVFDSINFSIAEGTAGAKVTLTGFASRPTLKTSAEKVVQKLEAVESVDNQIEVLSVSANDERIRMEAYARIYGHTALSRYNPNRGVPIYGLRRRAYMGISNDPPIGNHPIHIIVQNGKITLDGVVDTEADKNIAGIQANSVSGSFQVANNLQVLNPKQK